MSSAPVSNSLPVSSAPVSSQPPPTPTLAWAASPSVVIMGDLSTPSAVATITIQYSLNGNPFPGVPVTVEIESGPGILTYNPPVGYSQTGGIINAVSDSTGTAVIYFNSAFQLGFTEILFSDQYSNQVGLSFQVIAPPQPSLSWTITPENYTLEEGDITTPAAVGTVAIQYSLDSNPVPGVSLTAEIDSGPGQLTYINSNGSTESGSSINDALSNAEGTIVIQFNSASASGDAELMFLDSYGNSFGCTFVVVPPDLPEISIIDVVAPTIQQVIQFGGFQVTLAGSVSGNAIANAEINVSCSDPSVTYLVNSMYTEGPIQLETNSYGQVLVEFASTFAGVKVFTVQYMTATPATTTWIVTQVVDCSNTQYTFLINDVSYVPDDVDLAEDDVVFVQVVVVDLAGDPFLNGTVLFTMLHPNPGDAETISTGTTGSVQFDASYDQWNAFGGNVWSVTVANCLAVNLPTIDFIASYDIDCAVSGPVGVNMSQGVTVPDTTGTYAITFQYIGTGGVSLLGMPVQVTVDLGAGQYDFNSIRLLDTSGQATFSIPIPASPISASMTVIAEEGLAACTFTFPFDVTG